MNHRAAFSLVELSIVLVILGLLVGGILAGQSLIRASELRAVSTEYARYATSANAFRDKYFAVPGDMKNAQTFWGPAASCPGTASAAAGSGTATCNGDGDGAVNCLTTNSFEYYRFWQHLSNAGLVEGVFNGVSGDTSSCQVSRLSANVPVSKASGNGWSVYYPGPVDASSVVWFDGSYGNMLITGSQTTNSITDGQSFKPEEAWNVDTKNDDGKPGTGRVRVFESQTSCHDAGTSTTVLLAKTANYSLSVTTPTCALIFNL